MARREAEDTEDDDDTDGGLLLDQPDDWVDGANMRLRDDERELMERRAEFAAPEMGGKHDGFSGVGVAW